MGVIAKRLQPESWTPTGVEELEPNALCVVRSTEHRSVIAGPGTGKTELLAQRAAHLLQTGGAPAPQRILAISFKRDAASNLAARVRKRCHPQSARRFDSLTFDAFAKGLLDRFGQVLPKRWRPSPDYEIVFPNDRDYQDFLQHSLGAPPESVGTRTDVMALTPNLFKRCHLFGSKLSIDGWVEQSLGEWAADQYWQSSLRDGDRSRLSFPMIGRLVELLLRVNSVVRDALCLTYSHLFLDEFQDTTQIQYDLVRTIFLGADTIVTAVGDNKQQIMRWAMAMDDPFAKFYADFKPTQTPLCNNYRSSPELVRVQHILAQALDSRSVKPISKIAGTVGDESCVIWEFTSPKLEADKLAEFITMEMKAYDLRPRDFVLLVRQKAEKYAAELQPAFADSGIPIRNEAAKSGTIMLQDLLAEEVSELTVCLLRLAMTTPAGRYWTVCQEALGTLRGIGLNNEIERVRLANELDNFTTRLGREFSLPPKTERRAQDLVDNVLEFVGRGTLIAANPAYGQGNWLEKVLESASIHLAQSAVDVGNWTAALDAYEGLHAIPLMTIHKSKGLEYHSVIFVGLDDDAWWSFDNDRVEGMAGFYVAFTRAKQRVVFTYCKRRGSRIKIDELYRQLEQAGVQTIKFN